MATNGQNRIPKANTLKANNPLIYRLSQFVSLLLGARIFVLMFFTFALYVSTFFLFNQEEGFRKFVFDYKVHGIILCSALSIAAGGIINQFYDLEKDRIQKPFRTRLQSFLRQKYFLYSYILLSAISLALSAMLSWRIFIFFLIYQFFIWFYSHKLSRVLLLNNLAFVSLSLYPFFGLLVYYQHFSMKLFLMALFLFTVLLAIDILKDILTVRVDKTFNYNTLSNTFGIKTSSRISALLLISGGFVAAIIAWRLPVFNYLVMYYAASAVVLFALIFPLIFFRLKNVFWVMNLLRLWLFVGVIFMLLNGIFERY